MDINPIISYIISPELQETLYPLKVASFIVVFFFLGFITWAVFKTMWIKFHILFDLVEFLTMRPYGVKKVNKIWNRAAEKVRRNDQREYKHALVDLDKTLDSILRKSGNKGKNLEERLSQLTEGGFPPLLRILEAHKICEEIKTDLYYDLEPEEAEKMLAAYKEAFLCLHAFN
ncbi:hypothetical protein KAR26_03170 [Candidatus Parcubacteria bacterium]|nr:hypothetical protein [Candidatus Parcubacteria bacterium]